MGMPKAFYGRRSMLMQRGGGKGARTRPMMRRITLGLFVTFFFVFYMYLSMFSASNGLNDWGSMFNLGGYDRLAYERDGQCSECCDTEARMTFVAVVVCTTSNKVTSQRVEDTALSQVLLPSLGRTIETDKYRYELFVGIDDDDAFWMDSKNQISLRAVAASHNLGAVQVHAFPKSEANRIPWNEILLVAKKAGADYIARLNDDTELLSAAWTSTAIHTLASFDPPNVGVVGPTDVTMESQFIKEGKGYLMTHDMVHAKTHMEIFGDEYYPRRFKNWYLDDWISLVYGSSRTTKISQGWRVKHHTWHSGTRYNAEEAYDYGELVEQGSKTVTDWLERTKEQGREGSPMVIREDQGWLGSQQTTDTEVAVTIVVLATDRPDLPLCRLLKSLQEADYDGDVINLWVKFNLSKNQPTAGVLKAADYFAFPHGNVRVEFSTHSWLSVWDPDRRSDSRGVIFEDTVDLSPHWYTSLKRTWAAYGGRTDIAGISFPGPGLSPTFPPYMVNMDNDNMNNHSDDDPPFLYHWEGSNGFSPHPERWEEFLAWVYTKDLNTYEAEVGSLLWEEEGMVTTLGGSTYEMLDRRSTWTQLFVQFCDEHSLHMLDVVDPYAHIHSFLSASDEDACKGSTTVLLGNNQFEPDLHICMPKLPCIVYSFGIADNWIFDDLMLDHGCSVWSFDPSMEVGKHKRRPTHLFEPIGIGAESGIHGGESTLYGGKEGYEVMSLEDLMARYGHDHIDVLRMDTESAEWEVLAKWNKDNIWPKIGQLLMEIHFFQPAANSYFAQALDFSETLAYARTLMSIPMRMFHVAQNKDPSAMIYLHGNMTRVYEVGGMIEPRPNYSNNKFIHEEKERKMTSHHEELKPFKIVILTQRRYESLQRLLDSVASTQFNGHRVHLEIRIDFHDSADHQETYKVADAFNFEAGTKSVVVHSIKQGLQRSWFEAWIPESDDERGIILEDDLELSPLWFEWLIEAWENYGNRTDLGGISLCRQRLNGSDGSQIDFESDTPFLYRMVGSWGFSPNPRYWRAFAKWTQEPEIDYDLQDPARPNVDVVGTIATKWHHEHPDSWEQYWLWWCQSNNHQIVEERGLSKSAWLYNLYAHPRNGVLIRHWAESGVHYKGEDGYPEDELLTDWEPMLRTFPADLDRYGWDFETLENRLRLGSLVVLGAARDVAEHSAGNVATITGIANFFELLRVIVFENDSEDTTLEALQTWEDLLDAPVEVLSVENLPGTRTERLAHARNTLWSEVRQLNFEPDYVLMLDFDGLNNNLEGVEQCLRLPTGWGGCCVNQRTMYYDLWALRTFDKWVDCDVWYECTNELERKKRFRHISSSADPIQVRSCFGGATLYKYDRVSPSANYIGQANGHEQCEHVAFHESLGAPLYIQPSFLNDAPKEHLPLV